MKKSSSDWLPRSAAPPQGMVCTFVMAVLDLSHICVVLNLYNYISVRAYVVMDDYFWWYPCVLYQPLCTVDFVKKKHKKSSLHHVSFLTKHCRKRFCSNFDSSCRVVCEETKSTILIFPILNFICTNDFKWVENFPCTQ